MAELYLKYEYWIAASQLILAMLGMGATLTKKDFLDVFVAPKAITVGLLIQTLLVPLMAYLFLTALGLHEGVAIGIALIAAVPGGTVSNIFTYFARGNTALSISNTALSTLLCLVATPLILAGLIGQYLPAEFSMPTGQIMKEIGVNLLLPLVLGMVYLRYLPSTAPLLSRWCIRGSLLGIILIVIGSAITGRLNIDAFGYQNLLMVVVFAALLFIPGYLVPKLVGLSTADITATMFEVNMRNINLGILIKVSIFPAAVVETAAIGNAVLFTLIFFGFLQLLATAIIIPLLRARYVNKVDASVVG